VPGHRIAIVDGQILYGRTITCSGVYPSMMKRLHPLARSVGFKHAFAFVAMIVFQKYQSKSKQ
jgi:hypothetical protein